MISTNSCFYLDVFSMQGVTTTIPPTIINPFRIFEFEDRGTIISIVFLILIILAVILMKMTLGLGEYKAKEIV